MAAPYVCQNYMKQNFYIFGIYSLSFLAFTKFVVGLYLFVN